MLFMCYLLLSCVTVGGWSTSRGMPGRSTVNDDRCSPQRIWIENRERLVFVLFKISMIYMQTSWPLLHRRLGAGLR